jgi:RteC protein
MQTYFEALMSRLTPTLEEARKDMTPFGCYTVSVRLLHNAVDELMAWVQTNPFSDKTEEIRFFRDHAPDLHSRFFYYMKLEYIESCKHYAAHEKFKELLQCELHESEQFFIRRDDFCSYYHKDKVYWDEYLYIRRGYGYWSVEEPGVYIDKDFTIGAYWASWMKAHEHLRFWLKSALAELDQPNEEAGKKNIKKLTWTANQVDAIELLFSLHLAKCFNNGEATLKDVMTWGEYHLGISLGNFHVAFQEMGQRKISRTKFTDSLPKLLNQKFDSML